MLRVHRGEDAMPRKSANVHILKRPLDSPGTVLSNIFGDPGKHWALIVEFKDNSAVYLCEVYSMNMDTLQVVSCASRSGSGMPGNNFKRFMCLEDCKEGNPEATITLYGTCQTNDAELENIVKNEARKEEYHLITANCQKFVEKLIELLKVEKEEGFQELRNASDLAEDIGWSLAIGAGILIGGYAVAKIVNANSRRNDRRY